MIADNEKTIEFFIDDKPVSAKPGTTIIKAAEEAGVYIPHYCYHPALSIVGSCRLCLVEMHTKGKDGIYRKMPKLQIACQIPVAPDTKVYTNTPEVENSRQGMMEFLLANHPLDCPICDRGGECMLQRFSMDYGIGKGEFADLKRRYPKPQFDKLIDLERNRCILCTRCIRFSHEIIGRHVFSLFERGGHTRIGTYKNDGIPTHFSGNVIDLCPVGALTSKPFRFKARNWELLQVASRCSLCAERCAMTLWIRDGKVYRATPPIRRVYGKTVINEDTTDFICNFGRFCHDYGRNPERLSTVQLGKKERRTSAKYEDGIKKACNSLSNIIEKYGGASVGIVASSRLSNESLFKIQHFARAALHTNNVDFACSFAGKESADVYKSLLQFSDADFTRLEEYSSFIFINLDLYNSQPITALKIKETAKRSGADISLIGHINDEWLAQFANHKILCRPDKTAEIIYRITQEIKSSEKPDEINSKAESADKDIVSQIKSLALKIKNANGRTLILTSADECSGLSIGMLSGEISELKSAIGNKADFSIVYAGANAYGAFALGCSPERLPGSGIEDKKASSAFESLSSSKVPQTKGKGFHEMLEGAASGDIKAMLIFGADDISGFPSTSYLVDSLKKLDALIVLDIFPSLVSENADIVFPIANFDEEDGTATNFAGNIYSAAKGSSPKDNVKPAAAIIDDMYEIIRGKPIELNNTNLFSEMMKRLAPRCPYSTNDPKSERCPEQCKTADAMKYRTLEGKYSSLFPDFSPLCRIVFSDKGKREKSEHKSDNKIPSAENGFILTWSFDLSACDHRISRSETFKPLLKEPFALMNPDDAKSAGIADNSKIMIDKDGYKKEFNIRFSGNIAKGALRIYNVNQDALDSLVDIKNNILPVVKITKA